MYTKILIIPLMLAFVIAGCSGTQQTADPETDGISWFIGELEEQGVRIDTRGSANLALRTEATSRLVVNNTDVVEIYDFLDEQTAVEESQLFVESHPRTDVYLKNDLLVVHYYREGSGIRPVLNNILGRSI